MAYQRVVVKPLDDQGLRHDRPTDEVKWADLDCVVRRGRFRKRPSQQRIGSTTLPASTVVGDARIIYELNHPAVTQLAETVRPDADGAYVAWTIVGVANTFQAVDETSPNDDTDYVQSSTDGQKFSVTFANPVTTFQEVTAVNFRLRCKRDTTNDYQLKLYSRDTGVDYVLGTVTVPTTGVSEYTEVVFRATTNPKTSAAWVQAELNSLELVVEKLALSSQTEIIRPDAVGAHNDWGVQGAANAAACLDDVVANEDVDRIQQGSPGSRTSVTFANLTKTFGSISAVELTWRRKRTDAIGNTVIDVFARRGGVNTVWFSSDGGGGSPITVDYANKTDSRGTHPDGTAWSQAEVNALEIGFHITSGTLRQIAITQLFATVTGGLSGTARVTQASAQIDGRSSSGRTKSKLFFTNNDFLRMKEDLTDFERITDTVAAPTAPRTRTWDIAEVINKVYAVNGQDQIYSYPDAGSLMDQFAAKPYGRTCASFVSRLILGDVTEGGTRTPQRIRFSAFEDPTDWAAATAGDLDLEQTPGRVVKLLPIGTSVLVAYKEQGIFNLAPSGDSDAPLTPFLRDPLTGAVAMATVKAFTTKHGIPAHLFLGRGVRGLNIFQYDGSLTLPVGDAVGEEIEAVANLSEIENAFAIIDPVAGEYRLWIAEGTETFPTHCWVYNLRREIWTKLTEPEVTAAGVWTLSNIATTVVGRSDSLPYELDVDTLTDEGGGAITYLLETGDAGPASPEDYWTPYAVVLNYYDRGSVDVQVSFSDDGGVTFGTATTATLGSANDGSLNETYIFVNKEYVQTGRRQRMRLTASSASQELDLTGLQMLFEPRGEKP